MQPAYVSKTLAAADVNIIAESQTPAGAEDLTLDGDAVSGGVAILDTQRQVLITQAADETGHTFTVYGTTQSGAPISEEVAGDANASVATVQSFKTVTRVSIDAAATGALQVGTNGVGATQWRNLNLGVSPAACGIAVVVDGTVDYTVNYTLEDIDNPVLPTGPTPIAITALSGQTTTVATVMSTPISGLQLVINSGDGTATMVIDQAGIAGP